MSLLENGKKLNPIFLENATYMNCVDEILKTGTTNRLKFDHLILYTKDHDFGYATVEDHRKLIQVYINGSNDFKDWISNCKFWGKNWTHVHNGFATAAGKFAPDIIRLCKIYPDYELRINGHSRGGGIAVDLACDVYDSLKESGRFNDKSLKLMTFGAPKVLTRESREEFNDRNIHYDNVIHGRDLVPCLAPPYKTAGVVRELAPRAKYFIPIAGRAIAHLDYYENIKRLS